MVTLAQRIGGALGLSRKAAPEAKSYDFGDVYAASLLQGISAEMARITNRVPNSTLGRIAILRQNPVAFQAIRKISWSVGSVKWLVDGKDDGDLYDLINKPQSDDRFGMFTLIAASLAATGNAYLIKSERASGRRGLGPMSLTFLRPDRTTLHYDASNKLEYYEYQIHRTVNRYTPEEVCHIRHPLLIDDYIGESVVDALFDNLQVHAGYMKLRRKLLENSGGVPSALVFEGDQALSAQQREELRGLLDDFKLDGDRFGSMLLLDGGVAKGRFTKLDLAGDISKLQPTETVGKTEEQIAQLFGIPRLLLGIGGDATFANQKEARRYFWLDTLIPGYLTPIATCLSLFLDAEIEPDLDSIPAIADYRMEVVGQLAQASWLTINEKRAVMGYEPVEGGDEVLQPASLIPITQDAGGDIPEDPIQPEPDAAPAPDGQGAGAEPAEDIPELPTLTEADLTQ